MRSRRQGAGPGLINRLSQPPGGVSMTLPDQRTRAFLRAREFLLRLCSPYQPNGIKGIKSEVRQEARDVLRHFPFPVDLTRPEAFDEKVIEDYYDSLP